MAAPRLGQRQPHVGSHQESRPFPALAVSAVVATVATAAEGHRLQEQRSDKRDKMIFLN